jgi:DNA-binding XRE family transcriptional regulator
MKKTNESHVRYLRLKKNMSKGELSHKTGISPTTLDGIENGRIKCSELSARRIAEVFDMDREWRKFLTFGKFISKPMGRENE